MPQKITIRAEHVLWVRWDARLRRDVTTSPVMHWYAEPGTGDEHYFLTRREAEDDAEGRGLDPGRRQCCDHECARHRPG